MVRSLSICRLRVGHIQKTVTSHSRMAKIPREVALHIQKLERMLILAEERVKDLERLVGYT